MDTYQSVEKQEAKKTKKKEITEEQKKQLSVIQAKCQQAVISIATLRQHVQLLDRLSKKKEPDFDQIIAQRQKVKNFCHETEKLIQDFQ